MVVLMPNASLGLRRLQGQGVDAHGYPVGGGLDPLVGPWPARLRERGPDGGWNIALDPLAWPVRRGDIIVDPASGQEWLVRTADLATNNLDPRVDSIRCDAAQRNAGHTEPGGPEFTAR